MLFSYVVTCYITTYNLKLGGHIKHWGNRIDPILFSSSSSPTKLFFLNLKIEMVRKNTVSEKSHEKLIETTSNDLISLSWLERLKEMTKVVEMKNS